METVRIGILNPKAKNILKDLADLNLIKIHKQGKSDLSKILKKLRSKSKEDLNLNEITEEVESVRKSRYEK